MQKYSRRYLYPSKAQLTNVTDRRTGTDGHTQKRHEDRDLVLWHCAPGKN